MNNEMEIYGQNQNALVTHNNILAQLHKKITEDQEFNSKISLHLMKITNDIQNEMRSQSLEMARMKNELQIKEKQQDEFNQKQQQKLDKIQMKVSLTNYWEKGYEYKNLTELGRNFQPNYSNKMMKKLLVLCEILMDKKDIQPYFKYKDGDVPVCKQFPVYNEVQDKDYMSWKFHNVKTTQLILKRLKERGLDIEMATALTTGQIKDLLKKHRV